ncbi:MAG: PD-(D/E)XK nuclease-like domain-containing protein [Marinomonas sp.]
MIKTIKYEENLNLKTGNYYSNMPNDIYHGIKEVISKSSLCEFYQSPFKFFNKIDKEPTKAMKVGTALHSATLEPELFDKEYCVEPFWDDYLTSEAAMKSWLKERGIVIKGITKLSQLEIAAKIYEADISSKIKCTEELAFELSNQGKERLKPDTQTLIDGMKSALYGNDDARKYLDADGFCEVSGFSKDKETGILCKHRFDKLAFVDGMAFGIDVKKTQDVSDRALSSAIAKYSYHVQAAFYSDQYEVITGNKLDGFVFLFVEESFPHEVRVVELDDLSIEIGRKQYKEMLSLFAKYQSGEIVAHNNESTRIISLPEYLLSQYENEIY